jgi:hypothetical protein
MRALPQGARLFCSWLLQALGRFWDNIGTMDSMVFEVAELNGATMICHTNSKKERLFVGFIR